MAAPSTNNPFLAAALDYAARGWRVVPLHQSLPGGVCSCRDANCDSVGKHPRTKRGLTDGTTDPDQIHSWWTQWARANVGVVCGRESGVWMVGPDGEQGQLDLAALCERHGDRLDLLLAGCAVSRSQGGGRHLVFEWPAGVPAVKNRKNHRGTKIDVRAEGGGPGYLVAPPSVGPKGTYQWLQKPEECPGGKPRPAPDWLVAWAVADEPKGEPQPELPVEPDAVRTSAPPTQPRPTTEPRSANDLHKRITDYLLKCPPSISGQRGHDALFWAARVLVRGFALSQSEALGHLHTYFNPMCRPKWSQKELEHKVKEAAEKPFHKPVGWLRDSPNPLRDHPPARAFAEAGEKAERAPAEPGEWPEPRRIAAADQPDQFPLDALPIPLMQFCRSAAAAIQCPPDYLGTYLLGVSAGLIGGAYDVAVGPKWTEPAILWTGVVADVSDGKSPALKAVMAPVKAAQEKIKLAGGDTVLFTDDATPEGLVSLLRNQPRGTLYADEELVGLVASFNQYKPGGQGKDRQTYLKMWDGGTASTVRRNPEAPHVYAPHARLSVVGALQPAVAGDFFTRDDGLPERMLLSYARPVVRTRYTRTPVDFADDWSAIADRLMSVPQYEDPVRGKRPYLVRMTAAAEGLFDDWTGEMAAARADPDRDRKLDGTRGKMNGYVARLSLVLRCLRAATADAWTAVAVEECDVRGGIRLARYFLAHADRVRGSLGRDGHTGAAAIVRWLRRKGVTAFQRRDVQQQCRRQLPKADDARGPLRLLLDHDFLRIAPRPQGQEGGAATYEVNPLVLAEQPATAVSDLLASVDACSRHVGAVVGASDSDANGDSGSG